MALINQNWSTWILASLSKHFSSLATADEKYFVQGMANDLRDQSTGDWYEFRFSGPEYTELSKDYYRIDCTVNLLIQSKVDRSDFHRIYMLCGKAASKFEKVIPVYSDFDTSTIFECFNLIDGIVTTRHFGQIDKKLNLYQATVEGSYHAFRSN